MNASKRRLALGPVAFLPPRGFVVVPVWPSHPLPDGTVARSALLGWVGDTLVAYANLCPHMAVSLDYGDGDVMDDDSDDLRCRHHGAVFDAASGRCIVGPCLHQSLWRWAVEVDGAGELTLLIGGEVLPEYADDS